jgi:beta-mannosidase
MIDTTIISDLNRPLKATLTISVISFDGKVYSKSEQTNILPAATATQVSHVTVTSLLGSHSAADTLARFVLILNNKQVADRIIYFDHVRNLRLPAVNIETVWNSEDGRTMLTLRSSNLARNVWIGFDDLDVQLSDNSFDLLPGIPVTVEVKGPATRAELERSLKVTSLSDAFDAAAFSASGEKNLAQEPVN